MEAREELPFALRNLAASLSLRRQTAGKTYHLLLASEISLTADLLARVGKAGDWKTFRQQMQALSLRDRADLLAYALRESAVRDGYQALADLILDGYFSTILTTNVDSLLEEALHEAGVRASDMQVLIVGRDQPEYIVETLIHGVKPITLLKLYGSLNEGVLPERFPDVFTLPREIEENLVHLLAQDMLVVGDLERELAIQRLFLRMRSRSAFYAAVSHLPNDRQDYASKILEARNYYSLASFIISGSQGKFHPFFLSLRSLLQPGQTTVVEVPPTQKHLPRPFRPRMRAEENAVRQLSEAPYRADVLLVAATPNEARAVLEACPNERRYDFLKDNRRPYHDLGLIGNARVALMMQSSMGAGGLGGARFTVSEGIQTLRPSAVIMVGIACGLKPDEQRIGDMLVSEWLVSYEPQRLGTEQRTREALVHYRGGRIAVPPWVLSYFKDGHLWLDSQMPNVFFGPILSGDKLVDNLSELEALLRREPEAIGLEMEGIGLYEVATHADVGWLLVKAISDWGDGQKAEQKEEYQRLAAENAARFTLQIIRQGGFAPHKGR